MGGRPIGRRRPATDPAPAPYRALTAALLDHLSPADGNVRQAAGRAGQDWDRQLLEPFGAPGTCVLRLPRDPS